MKNVYFKQYVAIFTPNSSGTSSVDLAVVPYKYVTYDEFQLFFNCRAKNLIGLEVVIEHSSTNLPPADFSDTGRRYEYWRWYTAKNGKRNVWECMTQGKLYKTFRISEGSIILADEARDEFQSV